MEGVCRTCLRSSLALLPLICNEDIIDKIETIAPVKITLEDDLPSDICQECINNVNTLYNFRKVIINNDIELKERREALKQTELKNDPNSLSPITYIDEVSEDHIPIIKIEIENEATDAELIEIHQSEPSDEETKPAKKTNKTKQLNAMLRRFQSKREYHCDQCDFVTKERALIASHKRTQHSLKGVCSICGKTMRKDNLGKHIKNHTSDYTCSECGVTLKNYDTLRSHMYKHKGQELHCEFCGKVFYYHGDLNRHVKRHITKRVKVRVNCSVCNKNLEKSALKKHMRSHTGERPYICEYCKKGFSSGNALKTHVRQHTKEKPYICEYCPMAFPQKVSLVTHIRSKHSQKDEEESKLA